MKFHCIHDYVYERNLHTHTQVFGNLKILNCFEKMLHTRIDGSLFILRSFCSVCISFSFSLNQSLQKVTTSMVMLVRELQTYLISLTLSFKIFFLKLHVLYFSGTGKTMVMDMFYSYAETEKKKRVHFHGFMLDVHKSEFAQFLYKGCTVSQMWCTFRPRRKSANNVHCCIIF